MSRSVTVEHNGQKYTGHVATIKSTTLGIEDHGIMTANLHCEWPGGGVSVGGYCLDSPNGKPSPDFKREGTAFGLDHIMQIMDTVGVYSWEKIPGKQVIVLFDYSESGNTWGSWAVGFANILDEDKVLILKEHAEAWLSRDLENEGF